MSRFLNGQRSLICAFFAICFWSSAFTAVKYCLDFYSPGSIMLFRFLVASAALAVYGFVKKIGLPDKKDVPELAACGFLGIFMYMLAFNTGTGMVKSGEAGFIVASSPVFTLILSAVFLREKATLKMWTGVLVSFCGLIIIALVQNSRVSLNLGMLILAGAAVCTSIYNILQRGILKKYSPISAVTYCAIPATIFMLIFTPGLVAEFSAAPWQVNIVIVYLGFFPAALAYFLWGYALAGAKKTIHVTMFLYLSPFMTLVFSFIFLNEVIPFVSFAGGLIIVLGMVFTRLGGGNGKETETSEC